MNLRLPAKANFEPIIALTDAEKYLFPSGRYYSKIYRIPYLERIKLAVKLLGNAKFSRLLDVGLGSGIFLPELSKHCDFLYGVDLHKYMPLVKTMLSKEGIAAKVLSANTLNLPFKNQSFDCIVCLSVLEFIDDTEKVICEIKRIAKDDSTIIIGAPVLNKITRSCYQNVVKFRNHNLLHRSGHLKIMNSVDKHLQTEKILVYPFFLPLKYALFFVLKAKKRGDIC